MNKNEFESRIDALRIQTTENNRLDESSRIHTYKTIALLYKEWRDLSQHTNLIEAAYKKANIEYRNRGNEINFRPFLRLTFGYEQITPYQNNRLTELSSAMRELDRIYNETPERYQSNTVNKLAAHIEQEGGISALISDVTEQQNTDTPIIKKTTEKKLVQKNLNDNELANRSLLLLSGNTAADIGTANINHSVRAGNDDLIVLIGKKNADGSIKILGSTNSKEAIDVAAIHSMVRNYSIIPLSLRQIAEVINTQLFPRTAMPKGKAEQSAWRKRIYLDQIGTIETKKDNSFGANAYGNPRRLAWDGEINCFIFSSMRSQRSVVTLMEPIHNVFPKSFNGYLKTSERHVIEEYITNSELELMKATPEKSLKKSTDQKYSFELATSNPFTGGKRNFHFYKTGRTEDKPEISWQTYYEPFNFYSEWKTVVDAEWFNTLRIEWLEEWFTKLGKNTQIKRENNFLFYISLDANGFNWRYNIDKTGISPVYKIPAKMPSKLITGEYKFRSKDMAVVLYNIADLPIQKSVTISGNHDAMMFEFKTDIGHYKIIVPVHFDKKHKIEDTAFDTWQ